VNKTSEFKLTGSKGGSSATSMADLMAKQSAKQPFVSVKKGETVKGTITKLTSSEILVDLGAKTEAVVLEKDKKLLKSLLSSLKVGDSVDVSILNPESDFGYPVVSLRRFLDNKTWEKLSEYQKNHTGLSATVTEVTRGGYMVSTNEGISGFMPNSYVMTSSSEEGQNELVGKTITVYVLELNRVAHKIIFSQKPVVSREEFEKTISQFKTGQKLPVVVTHITQFGLFVAVESESGQLDGLIHISEVSWDEVSDLFSQFHIGDKLEAVIAGFDKEGKRLELSIKRLTQDPFIAQTEGLAEEQRISGTVSKVSNTGIEVVFTANGSELQGMVRKEKIPPTVKYEVGQPLSATISQIDKARHKIYLVPVLKEKPIGYR
jgi:small subunit ribosomal protein S1